MAGVLGFEPRYAGIKTLCLTAWRHPNNVKQLPSMVGRQHRLCTAPTGAYFAGI